VQFVDLREHGVEQILQSGGKNTESSCRGFLVVSIFPSGNYRSAHQDCPEEDAFCANRDLVAQIFQSDARGLELSCNVFLDIMKVEFLEAY
jgi:hypothetical protein